VDQRVSVRCELTALDAQGVVGYVNHRLVVAGLGGSSVEFTSAALEALHQGSGGVPRVINRLCDRTLERAYAAGTRTIDSEFVWAAIEDLGPVHGIAERATVAKPAAKAPTVPTPSPSPSPTLESVTIIDVPAEAPSALMEEFRSEADLPVSRPGSTVHSVTRRQWAVVAVASMLIVVASVGVPAGYLRAHMVDHDVVTGPEPPLPHRTLSPSTVLTPKVASTDQASSPANSASPASASAANRVNYTILVASFTNPERAQRLVDELTNAGYRARVLGHDWGPPRGRLLQVNVEGYVSASDADRDLQQIRELPGGYRDARVIERE
jgi:cell division septation protein DedD